MNHVLAGARVELLAQFAWSKVLLGFDFDGTLAPIVADRDQARMRARTRSLLARVAELYPTAVISGRSQEDVERRTAGIALRHVVGNRGLDAGARVAAFERQIAQALPALLAELEDVAGIDVEDKRVSIALHYRRSRTKRATRARIEAAVAGLGQPLRVIPGKLVLNVVPEGASTKGDVLLRLRALEAADTAIYVGDDATDEDVFRLDQPGRLLPIRVGRAASSAATHYLRDQREIDTLLARLVALRAPKRGARERAQGERARVTTSAATPRRPRG